MGKVKFRHDDHRVQFDVFGLRPVSQGGNCDQCEADLAIAQAQVVTLTGQLVTANADVQSLTSQLATANADLATAQAQVASLTTQLATANASIATLTTQLATANATIATCNATIITLNSQLATANATIVTLNGQITTLNGQIVTLTAQRDAALAALYAPFYIRSFVGTITIIDGGVYVPPSYNDVTVSLVGNMPYNDFKLYTITTVGGGWP